jgi:hypothetical protein
LPRSIRKPGRIFGVRSQFLEHKNA